MSKPSIITLCGSSRFVSSFAIMQWELEKAGSIALGLHLLPEEYFSLRGELPVADHLAEHEGVAAKLNDLHLKKIEISTQILVMNFYGYIGDDTRREIDYAQKLDKLISFAFHADFYKDSNDCSFKNFFIKPCPHCGQKFVYFNEYEVDTPCYLHAPPSIPLKYCGGEAEKIFLGSIEDLFYWNSWDGKVSWQEWRNTNGESLYSKGFESSFI